MTKDVLVSISGLQFDGGETENPETIESITKAEYYKRNSHHYVVYDEVTEGSDKVTKNIIKFADGMLSVSKRGLMNVNMIFEENKKNMANYVTPYGNLLIGIDARVVDMEEMEDRIRVSVQYGLEINYEHMADCSLILDIRARGEGFTLQ